MTPEERELSALLRSSAPEPPMTITGAEIIERAERGRGGRLRRWGPVAATATVAAGIIAAVAATSIVPDQQAQTPAHQPSVATTPSTPADRSPAPHTDPPSAAAVSPPSAAPVSAATPPAEANTRPTATPDGTVVTAPPDPDRTGAPMSVRRCAADDLAATVDTDPVLGADAVVVVRNESAGACLIAGYPALPALATLDGAARATMAPAANATASTPAEIVLSPGGPAHFTVDQPWTEITSPVAGAGPTAGLDTATGEKPVIVRQFTIPGDPTPITLPTAIVLRQADVGALSTVEVSSFDAGEGTPPTTSAGS